MGLVDERMAGWLHGVSIDPSGAEVPAQIDLAKGVASSVAPSTVIDLVAYAHGRENGAQEAFAYIAEQARKTDEGWAGQQGSLLTRRLAAAALIDVLEKQTGAVASVCALAVSAASFVGFESELAELPVLADVALVKLADQARSAPELPGTTLRARVDAEFKTLPQADGEAVVNQQLREYLGETRAAVRALAELVEQRQHALAIQSRRTSEEIDLLWWVLEPFSAALGVPWVDVGLGAVVATGLEIARRLTVGPPPRGASGFAHSALARAGLPTEERTTLAAVVDSAPAPLLQDALLAGEQVCWSRPVLSALRERRETSVEQWAQSMAAKAGVSGELDRSTSGFALQLIRDISLDRLVSV